jgi:hypothetical protein
MNTPQQSLSLIYKAMGLFYIVAALSKAFSIYKTEDAIVSIGVRGMIVEPLAFLSVSVECLIGILMLFRVWVNLVNKINIVLLCFYCLVVTKLLVDGSKVECGCSGNLVLFKKVAYNNWFSLARNLVFLVFSCVYLFWYRNMAHSGEIQPVEHDALA